MAEIRGVAGLEAVGGRQGSKGVAMRVSKFIAGLALASALCAGTLSTVAAQQGVVIQNNGVDSTDSAPGADNVNISRASGMSSSNNGAGANNEAGRVVRDKERNRRDRQDDSATSGEMAPAETWEEAPAEGDYQAYAPEGELVDPAAPVEAVASEAAASLDPNLPVQLPNTGIGHDPVSSAWAAAALIALAMGIAAIYRSRISGMSESAATEQ
jgi:hypothetical protein